ncbi:MAG: lysine 2,3-aminomutase, partial [Geminicoccaceae bacterium]
LVRSLRGHHSGLCQPTYVLDLPGGHGKAPIAANSIAASEGEAYEIEDYCGRLHRYPPRQSQR